MKNFTFTTLIVLLLSPAVFSQTQKEPGTNPSTNRTINQAPDSRLTLLSPAEGKKFNSIEGNKPVLFRWTPIVPKPKEAVTYRLRVWQLMQGQSGTEAMRNNQPVITKDLVNITQTAISNLYTGPCKPPYLCDFIWAVEVLLGEDNSTAKSYGTVVPYTFRFEEGIKADTGSKYKTYQPGKPVFGNISQPTPGDDASTENVEYGNKGNAGNTGLATGKSTNTKACPIHDITTKRGVMPAGKKDCCLNPCCSEKATNNQGDPVHGVDVKLGVKY